MLKRVIIFGLTMMLIMGLVFTGCGQQDSQQTQPSETKKSADEAKTNDTASKNEEKGKYPSKPIELVVQYSAGGSTDMLARTLSSIAGSKYLEQPLVVVNKAGGGGTVGTNYVLKAKPDGYTIGSSSTGPFTTVPLTQDVPYDPINDPKYIINISQHPILLCVNADSPWTTLEEFVDYVKENPGKLQYGQNSPGGTTHLAMEMFRNEAGLDMSMVPYAGGAAEVVVALLGGHVDTAVMHPQEAIEHIKAGNMRALTVFSEEKLTILPDVPTAKEKGYDVVVAVPKGVYGPSDMPDEVVKTLHDAFKKTMEDEEFISLASKIGEKDLLTYMSGEEMATFMKNMYEKMEPLVEELGLKK